MVYGRVVISKNIFMVGYVTNMNGRMADDIPNCGWLIPTAGFREIPIDAIDSPCCAHFKGRFRNRVYNQIIHILDRILYFKHV